MHHVWVAVKPASFWDSVVVLSREDPTGQGRPNSGAEESLFEESLEVDFHFLSGEQIVLRLLNNGFVKSILLTDEMSLSDLLSLPLTGSPVGEKPVSDAPIKSPACFLDRGFSVGPVAENDVGIVNLESLETGFDSFDDVLPGKSSSGGNVVLGAPEKLGAEDVLVPWDIEQLDCLSDLNFGLAPSVDFGSVKEVDSIFPGSPDAVNGILLGFLGIGVEPITERYH